MNRYKILSLLALVILVVALPIYTLTEPKRMAATDRFATGVCCGCGRYVR